MKCFKIEMERAFKNKYMLLSLIIGNLIGIIHFVLSVIPKSININKYLEYGYPPSVYNSALILDFGTYYNTVFYFVVPLICALPFAMSYFEDIESGYIKNICIRTDKKVYLVSKYFSVFISAGVVCIIPILVNLILTMTIIPMISPEPATMLFGIYGFNYLYNVFANTPLLYVFIYIIIDFLLSGVLSCLALSITKLLPNKYLVMLTPFVTYFAVHAIFPLFSLYSKDIFNLINPLQNAELNGYDIFGMIILLFSIGFLSFFIIGGKDDIY